MIRAVARWRNVAELINTLETTEKVEHMQGELERLMQELGAEVTTKKKKKKSTSTRKPLSHPQYRVLTCFPQLYSSYPTK